MYKEDNVFVKYKGCRLEFSEEKNLLLKETRGLGFEDVVTVIEGKKILGDLKHSSKKYPHQRILVIKIKEYVYAVPYVIDKKRKVIFLKTVYPSRVLTDKYVKGGEKI
ncbi:toxin [Candidatus Daviesbacteria bacterium]|nr:toxin [Candidatus Daviesbacteria bacterium]